jgi:signal peptidase I
MSHLDTQGVEVHDQPQSRALDDATSVDVALPEQNVLEAAPTKPHRRIPHVSDLSALFGDLLVAVFISVIIILFLYQPVRVEGTSMLPMLEDQDRLFINKFAYRFGDIQRQDVVVFLYPGDHTKSYIKRVIAKSGDKLRIDHGQVYVNGVALDERYVPQKYQDDRSESELTVPAGEYFMMGDHRTISSDSRDFGPVPRSLIYGKAAFVYWPMDQAGVVR